jgi:HEPN domain-containing protein
MKKITLEWISIAEGDWATANREHQVTSNPNYKAVCFHSQQSCEKYLKAYLQEKGIEPKRTHDLNVLLDEILPFETGWEYLRESCLIVTDFAVDHRYPSRETTDS